MQRVTHPVFFSWDMCDLRGPIILSTAFVFSIQNFSGHVSSGVASTSRLVASNAANAAGSACSSASRVMNDARGD